MKTYWNTQGGLSHLDEWQPNCWIQVTCPTDMSDISDTDERARYEYDDGWMLIILRIPYVKEIRSRTPYTTVPLGIIHKRDVTITVCFYETNMTVPLQCRMVPEAPEADLHAHRQGQAQPGPRGEQ